MLSITLTDQQLIENYLNGEDTALEMIINRHKRKLFTLIKMWVKDTYLAEDIFQETFIKVIDTLKGGRYKEEGKFLPWISRIAHNLCVDHFRRDKKMPKITTPDGCDIFNILKFTDENVEDKWIRRQTEDKVRRLIEELPAEQKEIVLLRHYADLSFKEIAEITGVSINTALGRMRYALQNLRKVIAEKEISL